MIATKKLKKVKKKFQLLVVHNWYRPKPGPGPAAFLSHKFTTLLQLCNMDMMYII
jgi:hypothetical protein